jgi:tetratricopeptide (TPR) repeat protein
MTFPQKTIFFSSVWIGASLAFAAEELPEIRQFTTYPQADFSPAVSRNGKWLAFASERSGNLDIWVKRMPNGEAVQVTTHQADDMEPVWSPDGKRLVYVSKRRDAQGDLWMVKFDPRKEGRAVGEPVQLTTYLGIDRKPSFSPDGKKIVYVSDEGETQNLWIYDIATRRSQQLTRNGGTDPAWSPDGKSILFTSFFRDPGGDLFLIELGETADGLDPIQRILPVTEGSALDGQAAWSSDGNRIAFVRRDADTDGDGRITPQDKGHVWVKILNNPVDSLKAIRPCEFQITPNLFDEGEPVHSADGRIYFVSTRGKSLDIWSLPENGILNIHPSAAVQVSVVEVRFMEAQTEEAFDQEILEYRKVAALFPADSVRVARSFVRIGEIDQFLGKEAEAQQAFDEVLKRYGGQKHEAETAQLRMAALKVVPHDDRIRQCRDLMTSDETDASLRAEACILLGDLLLEKGDRTGGFKAYSKVISEFPNFRNWRAQALLRIGDFFQADGQIETANQSYFTVLKEFGDVPLWRDRAGQRLLERVQGSPEERIERFQKMIQDFSDYPSLMADAQFALVRILIQKKQYNAALRELEHVEDLVPNQAWALARSKIVQAEVNRLRGDDLRGIFLLESVIHDYGMVEGGRFTDEAKDALFNLCLNSAERLKEQGDYSLAASRYQKALDLNPKEIQVHRGLIETFSRLHKIELMVQSYTEQLKRDPANPVLLYGLGLALSYKGETDSEELKKSNTYLLQSLGEDYRIVYPYRTLGYNYEVLEHLAEAKRMKRQPLLFRALKTMVSPVSWVLGALPFKKGQTESGFTEKAIQVLITALELNDENKDPAMETALTQNLANNFYKLGEFGYAKALQYYRIRLAADSAFSNLLEKAVFYERAGHAALFMDETESSAKFLNVAVQAYMQLGREEDALRNVRRRAWLWQQTGKYEDAVQEYQNLAEKDERSGRWMDLELDYRNIAYNYHLMEEAEDALKYGLKAEKILATQDIPKGPPEKSYLRVGIFGFTIPVWGMEEIGGASAEGFTLADEQAFVSGLIGRSC